MEWWSLVPPSICAEILKMASHELIMQSIIDWFGQTGDFNMKIEAIPNTAIN